MRRALWAISAVLAVAAVTLFAVDLATLHRTRAGAPQAAVVVARTEAINFFSLDYTHIDANLANVLSLAVDPFAGQYKAKQDTIKQGVVSGKLISSAVVPDNATAVEFETATKAIVLVGVDATTRSAAASKPAAQTDRYRMRLTMEKHGSSWLVSSIEQVG